MTNNTDKKTSEKSKQKFSPKMQKRLVLLFMGIILAFVVLVGKITYINAKDGDKYSKIVLDQQQYDSRTIPFKRGNILDRNGTILATSEKQYNVVLDVKAMLADDKNVEPTIQVLTGCFGIDENTIRALIQENPNSRYNILLKGVGYDKAQEFKVIDEDNEKYPNVAGIWLEDNYVRTYPNNTLACDVIGFTVGGNVGNAGIESSYNDVLNGTDGRQYGYLDDDTTGEEVVKEAVNGNTVVSSIDVNVQSIVEKNMKQFNDEHTSEGALGCKNMGVIVMNPNTGEILAEASYPNFDLNNPRDLSAYYTQDQINAMSDDDQITAMNDLWNNFCVSDTYEPGSTVKPFTVAAALESGAISGSETYYCGGSLTVGGHDIHCHKTSGHGTETVEGAVADSCNVALMEIGMATGADNFCKYQHIFGFGEYTNIDLPGEGDTSGLLYNADDMKEADLATNSFGQNYNVTMTQLSVGFCSLINGGNYYRPHVVKEIQDDNGNVLENYDSVLVKKTVSEETSAKIRQYTKAVVDYGTGTRTQVPGYDVAGKTGTAEKLPRGNGKYVLSFVGYAPADNPQVLIYVVIDEPNVDNQEDTSLVTLLSQQMMSEIFPYLGIQDNGQSTEEENADSGEDYDSYYDESYDDGSYDDGSYDNSSYDNSSYDNSSYDNGSYDDGSYDNGSYDGSSYDDG